MDLTLLTISLGILTVFAMPNENVFHDHRQTESSKRSKEKQAIHKLVDKKDGNNLPKLQNNDNIGKILDEILD